MRTNKYTLMLNEQRELYLTSNGYSNIRSKYRLNNPELIAEFICNAYDADLQPVEKTYLVCMDQKLKVTGTFEVSSGTSNAAMISAKDIFRMALMANASQVVLCHNHPSGDTSPSKQDREVTKKIVEIGKLLEMPLVDHIIIGEKTHGVSACFYSFREMEPHLF